MQLWGVNGSTTTLADFTTHFSFKISNVSGYPGTGDGLAFVLVPEDVDWAPDRVFGGGLLGLFESESSALNGTGRSYHAVAIEFDTSQNYWDPTPQNHIGIDVNSIRSIEYVNVTTDGGLVDQGVANVLVSYSSATRNLSVSLTFSGSSKSFDVSHMVDLSTILPQRVKVGFTAASAYFVEVHQLYSWSFYSSIEEDQNGTSSPGPPPIKVGVIVGIVVGSLILLVILAILTLLICRRRSRGKLFAHVSLAKDRHDLPQNLLPEDRLGPKSFSYSELFEATDNFDEELKLGEGGFGDVYQGKLANSKEKVAVKRFKSGSGQGEKEYVSEIEVISMLKHKNLVQLKGWCHENGELLLVYEFMSNRSLDYHLFGKNLPPLTWPKRYKITVDLASALHYLQDGCDPFVLHRDIKSSNIMLDSNFNAKLGDFGLARLTSIDKSFKTTVPAGTLGYLAPEVITGIKASKASDKYSFGVVALEIASGRRPISNQSKEDPSKLNLVEWVWDLYGKGSILDAVDVRLNGEFNQDEARRLMVVGLWCCHPDPDYRPSIRQIQAVLNYEAAEPNLPPTIPRPTYISSTMNMSLLSSHASMSTEAGSSTTVSNMYTSSSTTITE